MCGVCVPKERKRKGERGKKKRDAARDKDGTIGRRRERQVREREGRVAEKDGASFRREAEWGK